MCSSSGMAPKTGSTVQTSVASRKPSCGCSSRSRWRQCRNRPAPIAIVIAIDSAKPSSMPSWQKCEKPSGTAIVSPNSISTPPSTLKTG